MTSDKGQMTKDHPPFLAHQFDTPEQQFRAGKLGMWLFLCTEILMFSGLFCAYAVYRHNHPEVFVRAAEFLNWKLGALNTVVLICSSLTMAWAVHSAHCNQQRRLKVMLGLTLFLAFGFLGVKAIEYHDKWKHHLLPGVRFKPELDHAASSTGVSPVPPAGETSGDRQPISKLPEIGVSPRWPAQPRKDGEGQAAQKAGPWNGPAPGKVPEGLAEFAPRHAPGPAKLPSYTHIFFGIYFVMTGLHGLHVLAGMVVICWLLSRARRGDFSSAYYAPVDLVGLYWHFVDIVWIYLFPLLYLVR